MNTLRIFYQRLFFLGVEPFFYNYTNFFLSNYKNFYDNYFFQFNYLGTHHMLLYWYMRKWLTTDDCCLQQLFPCARSPIAYVHVVQWRSYFSTRSLFYKKLNARIGYNRYLWENRLIGSSVNALLGVSYVFRLQSRKDKLSTLSTQNDVINFICIPRTKVLKRRHFSNCALGKSLISRSEPIQTAYLLGLVKRRLGNMLIRGLKFNNYLRLKKINFILNKSNIFGQLEVPTTNVIYFWKNFDNILVHYLEQVYSSINIIYNQRFLYNKNKEFKSFFTALRSLTHDSNISNVRITTSKLFASLSYLADKITISNLFGIKKFNKLESTENLFMLHTKTYFSFLRLRIANVNALFTSLWGRRHRNRVRWESSSNTLSVNRKKRIYFYTKVLPKLKYRLRRRKHYNTDKRIRGYLEGGVEKMHSIRFWNYYSILSLNYWSRTLVLQCQGLRYFRNFFSFFSNFKAIKYFSFLCQQFVELDTFYLKQLCFMHIHSEDDPSIQDVNLYDHNLKYLNIYKLYKFCSKYLSEFSKSYKNQIVHFNSRPAVLLSTFLFQNKQSRYTFFGEAAALLRNNLILQYQTKTYISRWLPYYIESYKNLIICESLLLPVNKVPQLFSAATDIMTPKESGGLATAHVVTPVAIMQYNYTFLIGADVGLVNYGSELSDFYSTAFELTIYAQLIEVYHILSVLFFHKIIA